MTIDLNPSRHILLRINQRLPPFLLTGKREASISGTRMGPSFDDSSTEPSVPT